MRAPCLVLVLSLAVPASAATLYKCVDAQGKTSFMNQPCDGPRAVAKTIEVKTPEPGSVTRYDRYYHSRPDPQRYYRNEQELQRKADLAAKKQAEQAELAQARHAAARERHAAAQALDARNARQREEALQRDAAEKANYARFQQSQTKVSR